MTDVGAILAERKKVHGDFTDDATLAQAFKHIARKSRNWETLSAVQREALEMDFTKTARILSGDPNHKDHWDDKSGYARLVSERL